MPEEELHALERWKLQIEAEGDESVYLTSTLYNLIDVIVEFLAIDKFRHCLDRERIRVEFFVDAYPEVYSREGEKIYRLYLHGRMPRKDFRRLFFMKFEEAGQALDVYLRLARKYERWQGSAKGEREGRREKAIGSWSRVPGPEFGFEFQVSSLADWMFKLTSDQYWRKRDMTSGMAHRELRKTSI